MAGFGAGDGAFVHVLAQTGALDTGWSQGLLGVNTGGKTVTLGESAVGGRLGTLGEGAGKSGWTASGGTGRDAMGAGAVRGMAVTLEKNLKSAWMAAN